MTAFHVSVSKWTSLMGAIALAASANAPGDPASASEGRRKQEIPFDEATIFFELNHTDGDLGIHALIDGDAWRSLDIEDPRGRKLLGVGVKGRLRAQGLTELFFESDEPPFDELSPEEFFERFPAGSCAIGGRTLENEELESVVAVSQVMPAPPANIQLSGVPAAENCDAVPLPAVGTPVVIDWDPVTTSHPDLGAAGPIEVAKYQLVVEREEPTLLVLNVDLPPDVTAFEVPEDFTALGDAFKFEIIVRAANGNQTAVESCFELE